MKGLKTYALLTAIYFLLTTLLGCAMFSKKEAQTATPSALEPNAMLKFSDIPTPAGFKLLTKDSYTFENQGVRMGVLKYVGKANPDLVVNFYKEQMPMHNWNLLNVVEYGERLLNFDRDNETCIVSLLPKYMGTVITISLGPKSQASKKVEKPIK